MAKLDSQTWTKQKPLGAASLAMAQDLGPSQRLCTVRKLCAEIEARTSSRLELVGVPKASEC